MSTRSIPTAADLFHEMNRLFSLIEDSSEALLVNARKKATSAKAYRKTRSQAFLEIREGTIPEREAKIEPKISDVRFEAELADAMAQAEIERSRNFRTQISALQTMANAHRIEAELAGKGPNR